MELTSATPSKQWLTGKIGSLVNNFSALIHQKRTFIKTATLEAKLTAILLRLSNKLIQGFVKHVLPGLSMSFALYPDETIEILESMRRVTDTLNVTHISYTLIFNSYQTLLEHM
jgi:hypothetical protein